MPYHTEYPNKLEYKKDPINLTLNINFKYPKNQQNTTRIHFD